MAKPLIHIPDNAANLYLTFLRTLALPTRQYPLMDQPRSYNNDAAALEELLLSIPSEQFIPPNQNRVFMQIELSGHGETTSNAEGRLTGITGSRLSQFGIDQANEQHTRWSEAQHNHVPLILVSHLPRGLQHAAIKYYGLEGSKELFDKLSPETSVDDYHHLLERTLDLGIVPTPLVGAQFFGELEGYIEKHEQDPSTGNIDEKRQEKNELIRQEFRERYVAENKMQIEREVAAALGNVTARQIEGSVANVLEARTNAFIDRLDTLSQMRRSPSFVLKDAQKRNAAQSYVDFYMQTANALLPLLTEGMNGKLGEIHVVTHSGDFDLFRNYFRNRETAREFHITRSRTPTGRGQEAILKLDDAFRYLNDPYRFQPIRQKTAGSVERLQGMAVDDLVKEGQGLVTTPLLKYENEGGSTKEYKTVPTTIKVAFGGNSPIIIFGHGGQGKSILASIIAAELLNGDRSILGLEGEYTPLLINAADLNEPLHSSRGKTIDNLFSGITGVQELPSELLAEHKLCVLIDDYQKLSQDYVSGMKELMQQYARAGHKVILLSRMEREQVHPPDYPGFSTLQIDQEAVAKAMDEFIEKRIPSEQREAFKKYASQYDSSVTGNFLTKTFLTMIYPTGNGGHDGVLDYIVSDSISTAIRTGKPLTRTQLYEAQTDYVIGRDLFRHHASGGWTREKIREEIPVVKAQLAELAYNLVMGKKDRT